jgi:hypothetical protein
MEVNYIIGYQEHDLENLNMITYHTIFPVYNSKSLFAFAYDYPSLACEGYQYGMYCSIDNDDNYFSTFDIFNDWVKNNIEFTLFHVAHDTKHRLIKKDIKIKSIDACNLFKYYPQLQHVQHVNKLLQINCSKIVNFQFYLDGKICVEFVGLNTINEKHQFISECIETGLLTNKHQRYIENICGDRKFSVKFKWDSQNKLVRKLYVRDVENWQRVPVSRRQLVREGGLTTLDWGAMIPLF